MTPLTRRRFIVIAAAAAAGAGGLLGRPRTAPAGDLTVWRGVALGAPAEIRLAAGDPVRGAALVARCRDEIERLEDLFSLYRGSSAVSRLNRDARIDAPDGDLLALLSLAARVHRATGGAFDPTVQTPWRRLAETRGAASSPGAAAGFEHVRLDPAKIVFARPGMAITLNGIAQGYITDRVADLLRREGLDHTLIGVGELRALGGRPDGTPWPVRISGTSHFIGLRSRALATSATAGTTFDDAAAVSHILDPRTGRPAPIGRQVSVEAPSAAVADALSTAFCVLDPAAVATALGAFPGARIVA